MNIIKIAGYAIEGQGAIWGVGATEAEALADAAREGYPDDAKAYPCSAGILAEPWRRFTMRGDVICTPAEADAADEEAERLAVEDAAIIDLSCGELEADHSGAEWAHERREMVAAMVRAWRAGHTAVRRAKTGRVVWASDRDPRLSFYRREAARQMADRLGDRTWTTRIAEERRKRASLARTYLENVGSALYGAEWVSPIARDLNVSLRTAQRWATGEVEVPAGVAETDLPALLLALGPTRAARLRATADMIDRLLG